MPPLLDRLQAGLFPIPPAFESLLAPEDAAQARRQALLQLGAGLLAQTDQPGGPAAAVGRALQGVDWQSQLTNLASSVAALQDRARSLSREQARQRILARFPPLTGSEPPQEVASRLTAMLPEFLREGLIEDVGQITNLLNAMKQSQGAFRIEPGQVPGGQPEMFRIGPTGQPEPLGIAPVQTPGQTFAQEQGIIVRGQKLYDDFQQRYGKDLSAFQDMTSALANQELAEAGEPAAQVNFLYAFIKAFDPTSVVREGEIALARQGSTLRQRALQAANVAATGGDISNLIPQGLVRQMADLMRRRQELARSYVGEGRSFFARRARSEGVDPDVYLPAVPEAAAPPGAQGFTPRPSQLRRP